MNIDLFFSKVTSEEPVHAYVDGACRGNPGPGGFGVYLTQKNLEYEISGSEAITTNNRMELMGAIAALESTPSHFPLVIFTDSTYVKMGITVWVNSWIKKGWKTANMQPVKNQDLWERLAALAENHATLSWQWVPGHSGNKGNDRADSIARQAIVSLKMRDL